MLGIKRFFCVLYLPRFIRRVFYIVINRCKLMMLGVRLAPKVRIYNAISLTLKARGGIIIGKGTTIQSDSQFNPLSRGMRTHLYVGQNATLTLAENVGITSSTIWCIEKITIGRNTKIGAGCVIMDNDAHSLSYLERRSVVTDRSEAKPISIGEDVLIGTNVIILKGVTIGSRAIIGAGSVVSKDVPEDCIAAGNPCRFIRFIEHE